MQSISRRRFMAFVRVLAAIPRVIIALLFWILVLYILLSFIFSGPPRIKKGSVLEVRPDGALVNAYTADKLGSFLFGDTETLVDDLIEAVDRASEDDRILGMWLRLDSMDSGGAVNTGDLAEAVNRFTLSGKPVIASSDSYDMRSYRVAAPADHIVVDRLGDVFFSGYGYWREYYAEGLEKLGADVDLFRSGESKTAGEAFILDGMSDTARRDEIRLLSDLWETWLLNVSRDRGIDKGELSAWINNYDKHLLLAGGDSSLAAQKLGLIDEVEVGGILDARRDEVFGPDVPRVDAMDYLERRRKRREKNDGTVAVIPMVGSYDFGGGDFRSSGSDDAVQSIEDARDSPDVKALVVRIDSPGGYVRSFEAIRRALQETREKHELPVVVSMGNVAASGGYWIALESDFILASPETITGSIGVFSLSIRFKKTLEDLLGIHVDGVGTTPWSGAGHPGLELDERNASLYSSSVADIDQMFRDLVADRRGLTGEAVAELAGGIPWTGTQALELGLVDEIGNLTDACRRAAEMAGLEKWRTEYFFEKHDPLGDSVRRFFQ